MIWLNVFGLLSALAGLAIVLFVRFTVGPSRFNTVAFYVNVSGVLMNSALLALNLAVLP